MPVDMCPVLSHISGDIEFTDVTTSLGSTFIVYFVMNWTGYAGGSITISYDPTQFEFIPTTGDDTDDWVVGGLLITPLWALTAHVTPGVATISFVSAHDTTTTGVLGGLPLHVKAGATDPNRTEIAITSYGFNDSLTNTVSPASIGNGRVEIGVCVPSAPAQPTNSFAAFSSAQKTLLAYCHSEQTVHWARSFDAGDNWTVDASEG